MSALDKLLNQPPEEYAVGTVKKTVSDAWPVTISATMGQVRNAKAEATRLQKIAQAVAELDKCDKAYFQARGGKGVVKLLDDYNNALDALLKVYRGEE